MLKYRGAIQVHVCGMGARFVISDNTAPNNAGIDTMIQCGYVEYHVVLVNTMWLYIMNTL